MTIACAKLDFSWISQKIKIKWMSKISRRNSNKNSPKLKRYISKFWRKLRLESLLGNQ